TLLEFDVLPPWYNTVCWYLTCCLLIIATQFGTFYLMKRRLQTNHLRRMKSQEATRLRLMNEQLQNEIEEKDAEIFTQTSFIIHKNELIQKLKEMVDEICSRNTQKA
ncbi:hypothetical protein PZH42_27725, partial [Bacteroides cellulosilyticus]|nr:hypothetical protein [Bacteroides cellulosilyticus]